MTVKQFKAPREKRPPLEFELVYERLIDGEWTEQTDKFKARSSIPGYQLMKITTALESGIAIQSAEMVGMLDSAIVPDDKDNFLTLVKDVDVAIPIDTLAEILMWLAEEYTGRPTQLA